MACNAGQHNVLTKYKLLTHHVKSVRCL